MSRRAVEIPKVGLVMENARLVRWLKNVGDTVKAGEPLLELETEKSVVEIAATMNGNTDLRVVELDARQDRRARPVVRELGSLVEERGVVLVALDHERVALAEPPALAERDRHAADEQ